MGKSPILHQPQSRSRADGPGQDLAVKREARLLALILRGQWARWPREDTMT